MPTRRGFFHAVAAAVVVPLLSPRRLDALERQLQESGAMAPGVAAANEDYWAAVRAMFSATPDYIHLENGYASPQPLPNWQQFMTYATEVNGGLSLYMRRKHEEDLRRVTAQLAELAGVPADELVITRNTTESLATVIHGIDLAPGDEAIMCNQDYDSMLEQFRQQSRRRGIVCREISLPLHPQSDEEILEHYAAAITPRTRLLLVTHLINLTGQVLPVRKIAALAQSHGIRVIVDAAHSFAHIAYTIPELGGDFFGTSLHKWLSAPLGAGLLHMKRERIAEVWPLFGDTSVPATDIRKFERQGTQPAWTLLAIPNAIRFHQLIGAERKEARLRYLQQYWTDRVRDIPKVSVNTPRGDRACGIGNVGIAGCPPVALAKTLYDRYRIYTVGIDNVAVQGVRITPQLFTRTSDLDALVRAITEIAGGAG